MSDHMKRIAAPRAWPLKRKANIWAAKQSAGAHSVETSMPATMVLRDMIGVCDTAKEAKRIIGNRELFVDGVAVKNPKAPIGFMDVISIPKMEKYYRMLITDKGKLTLVAIPEAEAKIKLCRLENKTKVKQGKIQLNLSGGRNIVLDENNYKTGDSLLINVEDQKVVEAFSLEAGAFVMVIEGSHAGKTYTVAECITTRGPSDNLVKFDNGAETVKSNVFVIGKGKSAVTLPEASQ